MAKRITIAIFCFIAFVGLVLSIIGFALGGVPGYVSVSGGTLVYHAGSDAVTLGKAPRWWRGHWYTGYDNAAYVGTTGHPYDLEAPAATDIQKVTVNISAGVVNVITGDVPSATIDGPLACTSRVENGEWIIESIYTRFDSFDVSPFRFWINGQDVTTTYTIVLPKELSAADIHMDMGKLDVTGLTADTLEISTEMGDMTAKNLSAQDATFSTEMGSVSISGFSGANANLSVEMGGLDFSGTVTDTLTAHCDMGAIDIAVPRPAAYSWDASVDLGSISIDNQRRSGSGHDGGGTEDAKPYFDLDCGLGSITVQFV